MIVLNWLFTNGHLWSNNFQSIDEAENYIYKCDLINNWSISKVWIDTPTEQLWIKEKH